MAEPSRYNEPATMAEARKRWNTHTRHVLSDEMRDAIRKYGKEWGEDRRSPYVVILGPDGVVLRFWRTTAGTIACGVSFGPHETVR